MAQVSGETPRVEAKRKLDEGLRNWAGGNAGIPEATVHSCILVRSPPTEMTQLVEDVANGSFEMFKRSRMETAGTCEKIPVRPYRGGSLVTAARTLPLQREHGTPFGQGGGSNRSREINVPNEMDSAGGSVAGEGVAGGDAAERGAAGGVAAGKSAAGEGAAGGDAAGAGVAGGGAADGRFHYGLKVRNDNNGDLSLYWTEDFMRVLEDRNFSIQLGSREGGGKVLLTFNAISDERNILHAKKDNLTKGRIPSVTK